MMFQLRNCAVFLTLLGLSLAPFCAADSIAISPDTPIASLKAAAKEANGRGARHDALNYFDAIISREPSDYLTIFQRGAIYLSLGRTAQASADFDSVLKLKPGFDGALLQRAKLRARNADWTAAKQDYIALGEKGVDELAKVEEAEGAAYLAIKAEESGDLETCINQSGLAIMTAGAALSLRQLRARCRFERGEVQEGVSDLQHVLSIAPGSIEPHLQISAMLFYSLGDTERGLAQIKKCLHSDPDSKPCKKLFREEKVIAKQFDKLQAMISNKQYNSASKLLVGQGTEDETGLLAELKANIDQHRSDGTIHAKASSDLYSICVERTCEAYVSMKSLVKAKAYCVESLDLNPTSLYGLLYQAQKHMDNESFEAAITSLNTARDNHPDSQNLINEKIQEAQVALKRSKTKDYYKVLGVPRNADERTIRKAYRTATKIYHPDKAAARGESKEEAEKKMASINEAYEVLNDPELKARFDRGDDPNDPMANQGGSPFQGSPFGGGQQFFFQSGGQQFKFSGGGPGGNPFAGFAGFG
ncbi:DnaJ like subfamily C member 3 [Exophiala aquamarina CBS 119918]|uniref:Tetratricopeptide repeat and J domain-containing co-chaperone DNJ1 n=1 Tax=Exophiala aquamarina CBS 119918 TaxID=1182545 RepID=A0A072PR12_9EURO|nr:DnaJ like subfamily C member 3 [Exophiala aquamarina CBS 119918]KEF62271.1 DnaJ like subfamily C member 3 [Exophiala aquamarina CBS 119918]